MIDFQRLKDIREDNDINQETMSQILGVPRSTYSMWELGISVIPLKPLCDFADYFNITLDYALGLTNNKTSKNLIKGLDLQVLANNMKEIRKKNNLSQENIADILKVTQSCIVKYEKGRVYISTENLYKFAKEFKISINELCGKTKK